MIAAGMEVQSSPMQWSSFLLAASNDLERLPRPPLSPSLPPSSPVDLVWYGRAIAFLPSTRRARWVAVARPLGCAEGERRRTAIACSLARVLQQEKEDDATPRGSNEQRERRDETRGGGGEGGRKIGEECLSLSASLSPPLSSHARSLSRFPPEISVNVKVKEGASGGAAKEEGGFCPLAVFPGTSGTD